jgi:deoxyhypusine monooxygenase
MYSSEQIQKIGDILNDPGRPLKERFRALFTLKNIGGLESIDSISKAFDDKSALLKHEVAYCLGQVKYSVKTKFFFRFVKIYRISKKSVYFRFLM